MSANAIELTRVFRLGSQELPDPDPSLSPEDVKQQYTVNHPELKFSAVKGPSEEGDRLVYTFSKPEPQVKG